MDPNALGRSKLEAEFPQFPPKRNPASAHHSVEASTGMPYLGDATTISPRLIARGANTPPTELFQLTMLRALLLPPRCRDVYVLKEMHGYSPDEIATALRMSTTDVKRHLRRAMREMSAK